MLRERRVMLLVHIGMPKTGTTALQSYLHAHPDLLRDRGIHYMVTGRDRGTGSARLISHNSMVIDMNRGWVGAPADQVDRFRAEYRANRAATCILSSEMLFGRGLAAFRDRFLDRLDAPVQILVYLRRFDDFIEADYKQRAKNGMLTGGVAAFVQDRLSRIDTDPEFMNFGTEFERLRQALPGVVITPRLYLRDELVGGDVIADFLAVLGVAPDDITLPKAAANLSLSRLASEALGTFHGRGLGFDKKRVRRIGRALQKSADPRLFAKGDVLTPQESALINDTLEARNAALRAACFPGRDRLFAPRPSADADADALPARGHPGELAEFQYAVRAILKLIAAGY